MCLTNARNNCLQNPINIFELDASVDAPDIDYESTNFINILWLVVEPSEILIKLFAFLPVVTWGIFGNVSLIYIIAKNRHLRSPTNLLVGNMAVADLCSLLIHPWVFLVYDFFQNYQLGEFGCKAEGAFECSLLLASVMNLSAISYDRLTAIVLPQETRLTRRRAKIVMATTWIAGFLLASPLSMYRTYKERKWLDFVEKYCTENPVVMYIYWHVIITMMVWIPLIIMSGCYIIIFIKLYRYEKKVKHQIKPITRVKYKAKVAKTMFLVVVVFIICRLPFTALIFYRQSLLKRDKGVINVKNQVNGLFQAWWFASKYLIFVNAGLNPIIYGLMNEKFRKVFRVTPVLKWIFICDVNQNRKINDERRKPTKESTNETYRYRIFSMFKTKSRFTTKEIKLSKEVTISENHNKIIHI